MQKSAIRTLGRQAEAMAGPQLRVVETGEHQNGHAPAGDGLENLGIEELRKLGNELRLKGVVRAGRDYLITNIRATRERLALPECIDCGHASHVGACKSGTCAPCRKEASREYSRKYLDKKKVAPDAEPPAKAKTPPPDAGELDRQNQQMAEDLQAQGARHRATMQKLYDALQLSGGALGDRDAEAVILQGIDNLQVNLADSVKQVSDLQAQLRGKAGQLEAMEEREAAAIDQRDRAQEVLQLREQELKELRAEQAGITKQLADTQREVLELRDKLVITRGATYQPAGVADEVLQLRATIERQQLQHQEDVAENFYLKNKLANAGAEPVTTGATVAQMQETILAQARIIDTLQGEHARQAAAAGNDLDQYKEIIRGLAALL